MTEDMFHSFSLLFYWYTTSANLRQKPNSWYINSPALVGSIRHKNQRTLLCFKASEYSSKYMYVYCITTSLFDCFSPWSPFSPFAPPPPCFPAILCPWFTYPCISVSYTATDLKPGSIPNLGTAPHHYTALECTKARYLPALSLLHNIEARYCTAPHYTQYHI